jgi:hypothetical protein
MQIIAIKVERGTLPANDRYQALQADFLCNDSGIVLKDCQCVWDTETGVCVVTPPDNISFYNVFFQTAFASMAMQAALLLLGQQCQASGSFPTDVKSLRLPGWVQ